MADDLNSIETSQLEALSAFIDEELDPEESGAVVDALKGSPVLRTQLQSLKGVDQALRHWVENTQSPALASLLSADRNQEQPQMSNEQDDAVNLREDSMSNGADNGSDPNDIDKPFNVFPADPGEEEDEPAPVEAPADAEDRDQLVGERRETSVLFNLDTLTSAESSTSDSEKKDESSGLIDIFALTEATQAMGDAGGTSPSAPSSVAAASSSQALGVSIGHKQPTGHLRAMIAVGLIVVLGLVAAIVVVLNGRDGDPDDANAGVVADNDDDNNGSETEVQEPEQAAVDRPDPVAEPTLTTEQISSATLAAARVSTGVAGAAQALADSSPTVVASNENESRSRRRERNRDRSRSSREETVAETEPEPEREQTQARSSRNDETEQRGGDAVDDALSRVRRRDRTTSSSEEEDDSTSSGGNETLSNSQVSRTVRRHRRSLQNCRRFSDVPSGDPVRVDVQLTVASSGRVSRASSDSSDGAAGCLVEVFEGIDFPSFDGNTMNFTYPVTIR